LSSIYQKVKSALFKHSND